MGENKLCIHQQKKNMLGKNLYFHEETVWIGLCNIINPWSTYSVLYEVHHGASEFKAYSTNIVFSIHFYNIANILLLYGFIILQEQLHAVL